MRCSSWRRGPLVLGLSSVGTNTVFMNRGVTAGFMMPVQCGGKPITLSPGGEGRHLLDLRMHIRSLCDFCMHRAMWIGSSSPYVLLPYGETVFVLLHPQAAFRQIRQLLMGDKQSRHITLAPGDAQDEMRGVSVPTALSVIDPLSLELPRNDEEARIMANNAAAALQQAPPPGDGEAATQAADAPPSMSGPCHPSFWKHIPALLKAYEVRGPELSNVRFAYAVKGETPDGGGWQLSDDGDRLVLCTTARLGHGTELLVHHGRETVVHRLAATAFTSSNVDVDQLRWIEALLRDPRDIATPFPKLQPFSRVRQKGQRPRRYVLGNMVTRDRATNAAVLSFATRLSVVDPEFWTTLVSRVNGGPLEHFDGTDLTALSSAAENLLQKPLDMKSLRATTLDFLLKKCT